MYSANKYFDTYDEVLESIKELLEQSEGYNINIRTEIFLRDKEGVIDYRLRIIVYENR